VLIECLGKLGLRDQAVLDQDVAELLHGLPLIVPS
jgi:hypothetical protein